MLDGEALRIGELVERGDLDGARTEVRALVGRRADDLDEAGLSRAIVESIAENSVDAVTASLFWASLAGAPGVLAHRAVNTLDAMVGHRDDRYERFGWASARLDDLVNLLPARLTALAVACVRPRAATTVWRVVRRDAPAHPSPNGGVVEAAFAAALGVRLGGENRYGDVVQDRGTLGDGPPPGPGDIAAAVRLRRHITAAVALGCVGLQLVVHASRRRSR
jgi:adenosylcobinamide-phosphate synthase